MEPKLFGQYLREARNKKKLTLEKVAKSANLSKGYLSNIENGNRGIPSPDLLNKLSKPLGVSYSDLMLKAGYYDESMYKFTKDFEMYENEMETPLMQVLSLFIGGAGYINPEIRDELFLVLEDSMIGPDFARFNKEFRQYLINKQEAPDSISTDYEEDLYEEFDSLYNAKNLLIQFKDYVNESTKEQLLTVLTELAEKNNLGTRMNSAFLELTTLLSEPSITYNQKTLSQLDRQRILDMLELLFPNH